MARFSWPTWSKPPVARPAPSVLPGQRLYAIGDVHGRFDLLSRLLGQLAEDSQARGPAEVHVILLGDMIDRGAQSREIIDLFLHTPPDFARFHFVMGNHEEMLLKLIDTPDPAALQHFLRYGGRETFESYGAPQIMLDMADCHRPDTLPSYVPEPHRAFLRAMGDGLRFGDYFFVHAGIRPGVALDQQQPHDLRWIRGDFLDSDADHGVVVVHGHTVREAVEMRPNRIGIDTGAYATGRLTALGLEGSERWLVQTEEDPER